MITTERSTTIFGGDLIEHAQGHAIECAETLGDFPTTLHVVSGEEITTTPFSIEGLEKSDVTALAGMTSRLIDASEISWVALQTGIWTDMTGLVLGLIHQPRPHPLATEGVAIVVIDNEGADFYVAEVQRRADSVNLTSWHTTTQGPSCDANGVCS